MYLLSFRFTKRKKKRRSKTIKRCASRTTRGQICDRRAYIILSNTKRSHVDVSNYGRYLILLLLYCTYSYTVRWFGFYYSFCRVRNTHSAHTSSHGRIHISDVRHVYRMPRPRRDLLQNTLFIIRRTYPLSVHALIYIFRKTITMGPCVSASPSPQSEWFLPGHVSRWVER